MTRKAAPAIVPFNEGTRDATTQAISVRLKVPENCLGCRVRMSSTKVVACVNTNHGAKIKGVSHPSQGCLSMARRALEEHYEAEDVFFALPVTEPEAGIVIEHRPRLHGTA